MSGDISEVADSAKPVPPKPALRHGGRIPTESGLAADGLAERLGIRRPQVEKASQLLDEGLNPVFIACYRKAQTGGLEEAPIRRLVAARKELRALEDLRRRVRESLRGRMAETGAAAEAAAVLSRMADEATDREVLADLLDLAKPGRRTAGSVAAERGLAPLADFATAGPADGPDLAEKAAEFIHHEKEVHTAEDALAGAAHILAERISRDPLLRQAVRRFVWERGVLRSRKAKEGGKPNAEFRAYFRFEEAVGHLPPHRVLAINRGERSKALKVSVEVPRDALLDEVRPMVVATGHRFAEFLQAAVSDALDRLVLPAIERQVRRQLTRKAEERAIEVFAENLRSLLMTPPLVGKRVMAVQPGFRSGCKVVVMDADGALRAKTIVYPHEPRKQWLEAKTAILGAIRDHGVQVIAIGNGTGCRATEELVSEVIEENRLDLEYTIVNEGGVGIYADSRIAQEEFPDLEAALRATVSIARRLQDPLAELVKIDPRAIGVGLYQHDVDQERLAEALGQTIESCVCAVGVDANTASPARLQYVPGLGTAQVESLLVRRAEAPLVSREDLRQLAGWDERVFREAAGFLRIRGPNPLDATRIHPEQYSAAEQILERVGRRVADLAEPASAKAVENALTGIALEPMARDLGTPMWDLVDLVGALQHPDWDPRSRHARPIFRKKIRRIEDLKPGMWVKGTVRNVVDFGAFVDIGLKEDGLVHVSQFSRRYVRNPMKFLRVGDVVDVRIVSIDVDRGRIALTLIPDLRPPRTQPRGEKAPKRSEVSATPKGPTAKAVPVPVGGTPIGVGVGGAALVLMASDSKRTGQAEAAPAAPKPPKPTEPEPPPVERRRPPERRPPPKRISRKPREGAPAPVGRDKVRAGHTAPGGVRPTPKASGPTRTRTRMGGKAPDVEPRVHVFKDESAPKPAERDEKGRPKIRWAHYDSDVAEEEEDVVEGDAAGEETEEESDET